MFPIGVGLKFKMPGSSTVRTLVSKNTLNEDNLGMAETFDDNHDSAWTRGYLLDKFIKKEFEYIGIYKNL